MLAESKQSELKADESTLMVHLLAPPTTIHGGHASCYVTLEKKEKVVTKSGVKRQQAGQTLRHSAEWREAITLLLLLPTMPHPSVLNPVQNLIRSEC